MFKHRLISAIEGKYTEKNILPVQLRIILLKKPPSENSGGFF